MINKEMYQKLCDKYHHIYILYNIIYYILYNYLVNFQIQN